MQTLTYQPNVPAEHEVSLTVQADRDVEFVDVTLTGGGKALALHMKRHEAKQFFESAAALV